MRKSGKTAALAAAAVGMLGVGAGSAQAAFPGENGLIAYVTKAKDVGCCQILHLAKPDGTGTASLEMEGLAPQWLSGSPTFLFQASGENGGVAAYNTLTGTAHVIVPPHEGINLTAPSPAPWDEIAYQAPRTPAGEAQLGFMSLDGSNQRIFNVRGARGGKFQPHWSPSGGWIAYTGEGNTGVPHVYTARIDGLERTRLMKGKVLDWSPDGRRLLVRTDQGVGSTYAWEGPVTPIASDAIDGAYAPDGDHLVLTKVHDGRSDLYVTDLDGHVVRQLTFGGDSAQSPSWQAVGSSRPTPPGGNRPPDCSSIDRRHFTVRASKRHRWVTIRVRAVDPNGDRLRYRLEGVTQDEPVTARGDRTSPDAKRGRFGNRVRLRRERNRYRNGRVYRARFVARDGHGGQCAAAVYVSVPRKKGVPAVNSGSRRFDSMQRD